MALETITSFFQNDHEKLDRLFKEFRSIKACDIGTAREKFENFRRGLERHMAWEEEILFPLFESKTGLRDSGPTQVMRLEHTQMKTLLGELQEKLKQGERGDDDKETALIEHLTQHNHKEENILYPMIDRSVSEEEREEVFRKMKISSETGATGCCGMHT